MTCTHPNLHYYVGMLSVCTGRPCDARGQCHSLELRCLARFAQTAAHHRWDTSWMDLTYIVIIFLEVSGSETANSRSAAL